MLYLCLGCEQAMGHFEHRQGFFASMYTVFCTEIIITKRIEGKARGQVSVS